MIIDRKPIVYFIVDSRGWAFDNIAGQIKTYLDDRLDICVLYEEDYAIMPELIEDIQDCDLVHFFFRPSVYVEHYYHEKKNERIHQYLTRHGLTVDGFMEKHFSDKVVSSSVYDHLFLDHCQEHIDRCFAWMDCYFVSSLKLFELYANNSRFPKPTTVLSDGVDCQLFKPQNMERFDIRNLDRTIRVGWVGNSRWWGHNDLKGLHTIIKPAVAQLIDEGYNVELRYADRQERLIPHKEMPSFYADIDVYICASLHEGTPNTVLEAMACGVPVISTDVGIVSEAFGIEQKGFILENRTIQDMKDALKKILEQKELFFSLSKENLLSIKDWEWSKQAEKMYAYFMSTL